MSETNRLIYGKANVERIVGLEIQEDTAIIYQLDENLNTVRTEVDNRFWALSHAPINRKAVKLDGDLHYKYGYQFTNRIQFMAFRNKCRNMDIYSVFDTKEALMIKDGYTYHLGLKPSDVPILSFDIESTGLIKDETSKVVCITNTFRKNGVITRKLFGYDEYDSQHAMIDAWASWVVEMDPSVICGHNVFGYDFSYIDFCYKQSRGSSTNIKLGRDGGYLIVDNYEKNFRVDGSRDLSYKKTSIFGREIIDTMFLAIRYDVVNKKYESYGLKPIIKVEGLEKADRVFYDAATIRYNYTIPEEWVKIKEYCKDDGDDALALYDLMVPALFYFTRSIPKPFQMMGESATGSQLNALLVRSYLQDKHSVAKTSEAVDFPGAISFGVSGIYRNVAKIDVKSEYPSCILEYEIYDREKDPKAHFYKMVDFFTQERFRNKDMAKKTGDLYYTDLEQAGKIAINSAYGLLGASGLNYNSPKNAALVTEKGRQVITTAIQWASGKDVAYWMDKAGIVEDIDEETVSD